MKKRMFILIFLLVLLFAAAGCAGKTPEPDPAPVPFSESPCVGLKVKYIYGKNERYNLKLSAEKKTWSLVLTDHPGSILEPGTEIFVTGEAEDLPFERFLEVFRAHHAEAWDGWETRGEERDFALELRFGDGSVYNISGGEGPEGFDEFTEALVREMARFGEDWCGVEPQTLQERLLNVYPMDWSGGSMNDVYYASWVTLPLGEQGTVYNAPAYAAGDPDLSPFLGEKLFDHVQMSWYRVKDMKGLKYVISLDGEGKMRLWEYRYRDRESWEEPRSMADLLREIYAVEGPEDLRKIVVTKGRFASGTPADKTLSRTIEDRDSIEIFCAILFKLNWTGLPFEWKAQSFPEYTYSFTPEDGKWPPDTEYLEYLSQRRITLEFADGTTMDHWYYNAVYGYLERVYGYGEHIQPDEPLPPEDVYALNVLFGIE